jgi:hypothetical protein
VPAFVIKHTDFSVSDFLGYQRGHALVLSPSFQRRSVWKPDAKSFLIDTVVRGLPIPPIFIRERLDLDTQTTTREIVDGQQRLRTLFAFIDPKTLPDYSEDRDAFVVKSIHNADVAGKRFSKLDSETQRAILGYKFVTHTLPPETEDRDVLKIFARMNATGVKLNHQELRNAEYYGVFKSLMYDLAYEQLERWRKWRIFTEDQIARMQEVELTSDLVMNMVGGLTGKSQVRINKTYKKYEESFPGAKIASRRFRAVMDEIDRAIGPQLGKTVFRSEVNFFTLFAMMYDHMWGLGSALKTSKARELPPKLRDNLIAASVAIAEEKVPATVLDAMRRASADLGRRRTRLTHLRTACHAKAG